PSRRRRRRWPARAAPAPGCGRSSGTSRRCSHAAAAGNAARGFGARGSMSHQEHHRKAPASVGVAIVTVSDTRTPQDDTSGRLARELVEGAGHAVRDSRIVKDEPDQVREAVRELASRSDVRAVILTGGTGISRRDRTYEAVAALLERRLDGFGELFRMLS